MKTFTFTITDWFGDLSPLTLTVEAPTLKEGRIKARIAASLKGFDPDCLAVKEA